MYADTNFTSIITTTQSPYNTVVNVTGTDGFQFEAGLTEEDTTVTVWNGALFRPLNFTQVTSDTELYKHIMVLNYTLA